MKRIMIMMGIIMMLPMACHAMINPVQDEPINKSLAKAFEPLRKARRDLKQTINDLQEYSRLAGSATAKDLQLSIDRLQCVREDLRAYIPGKKMRPSKCKLDEFTKAKQQPTKKSWFSWLGW